jgi:signal transduction histidine kinase
MNAEWLDGPEPWAVAGDPRTAEESRRSPEAAAAAERGIADRFARLHAATAALSAAVTPADVAAVVAARGQALPGAVACWVGVLAEGGHDLHVAGVRGGSERAGGRPSVLSVTADLPIAAAVRERSARFLSEAAPGLAAQTRACGFLPSAVRALAALPLGAGERILGAVAIAFAAPQPFDEEERAFLQAFAHQCAQALDRARLYEAERAARLEAQRAEESARRAVELKERLVGIVGHDLRTPLASIRMAAALLARRGELSGEGARTLARLGASATRMTGIIRDLLDFTRIRKDGAIPLEPRDLDLAAVARGVVAELQEVHPERVIALEAPQSAPGRGDPDRLAQVLSNLVGNAIQHSPAGSAVAVRVRAGAADLALEVHNHGPPIPASLVPHVFEPFRQGPRAPQDASGSVGLGLFIVQELVRAHGGSVRVESFAEAGTTFTVSLPA